jgi:lipopolysaccharide/colanic/teichoic acid biosynthesis glycosyltransferase
LALGLKRAFDVIVASIALICCLPILLVAMAAICLESSGSPIFVQKRIGKDNQQFSIIKLRTMYLGAERLAIRTASNDGRITKVGRILRSIYVDELPQLLNIIRGDMSIIGPRPLSSEETSHIIESLTLSEDHPGLCPTLRPGLVGLEQVNRTRALSYVERFRLNHEYEKTWSPALDVRIFIKSVVMCRGVCLATGAGGLMIAIAAIVAWSASL